MKCTTRHVAAASIVDQDVPASAVATSLIRLGTASFSTSALAISWATRASVGEPLKTVRAAPAAPDVQPVPTLPGMAPHCVAVSPMVHDQVGPGSIPVAPTAPTSSATADASDAEVAAAVTGGADTPLGVPDAAGPAAAGVDADVAAAVRATDVGVVTAGEVDAVVTGEAATGASEGAVACDPAAPAVQTLPASQAGAPVRASATGTEEIPIRSR